MEQPEMIARMAAEFFSRHPGAIPIRGS